MGDAGQACRHRARIVAAVRRAASIPRRGMRRARRRRRRRCTAEIEAALEDGREPRRGPHHPPLRQPGRRRRCAPISSSSAATACRAGRIAIKFDSRAGRRPAAAAAALRDLRLLAARRGRASALRPGRARRPALVRPAAGFPHRGARPGQGAAGQERRHRAGRRQGRLRAEAPAGRRRPRRRSRPRASRATRSSSPALLDITDNIVDGDDVVPPADVVRHDGDDPYLVVAADKGTATFSDIANAIAQEHGFWLGDAFASGGSAGYDHKKMGITARGAWEAVKRHFREMDVDIQTDAVHRGRRRRHVGRRVRQRHAAVAADHGWSPPSTTATSSSIPTPIRQTSFAERKRLFDAAALELAGLRPSADLARAAASFARRQGDRRCRRRRRRALGLRQRRARRRSELMQRDPARRRSTCSGSAASAPMCAPPSETDAEVGDRANDAIRVDGARAARQGDRRRRQSRRDPARPHRVRRCSGGALNTDAIDNSAGVNTSDLEVNIKIALGLPMRDGRLDARRAQRAARRR